MVEAKMLIGLAGAGDVSKAIAIPKCVGACSGTSGSQMGGLLPKNGLVSGKARVVFVMLASSVPTAMYLFGPILAMANSVSRLDPPTIECHCLCIGGCV
jgi:hypothetical protein